MFRSAAWLLCTLIATGCVSKAISDDDDDGGTFGPGGGGSDTAGEGFGSGGGGGGSGGGEATDSDGDGYTTDNGDCDDGNAAINPEATDMVGDDIDQNCDGIDGYDGDGDGFASGTSGGDDCDDEDDSIYPGATETWYDGIDSDCDDGTEYDADDDGWDIAGSPDIDGRSDCDDTDASIHPNATDTPADGVDSDCDGIGEPVSEISGTLEFEYTVESTDDSVVPDTYDRIIWTFDGPALTPSEDCPDCEYAFNATFEVSYADLEALEAMDMSFRFALSMDCEDYYGDDGYYYDRTASLWYRVDGYYFRWLEDESYSYYYDYFMPDHYYTECIGFDGTTISGEAQQWSSVDYYDCGGEGSGDGDGDLSIVPRSHDEDTGYGDTGSSSCYTRLTYTSSYTIDATLRDGGIDTGR